MECDFSFVPFLVLTVDQFVGRSGSPLERQKEDSQVYREAGTLPLHIRRSLRNCSIIDPSSQSLTIYFPIHTTKNIVNFME